MTRGVRLYLVGSVVLVSLAGCGRGFFQTAEREPWRREAEVACLKSGTVKETADLVRINPISGPGMCGAEFPLKVAAFGETNSATGFADESLRPPAGVGRSQPRWPVNDPPRAYPAALQSYPANSNPTSLSAPGVAAPEPDDADVDESPRSQQQPYANGPGTYRTPYGQRRAAPDPQYQEPPRLGPSRGNGNVVGAIGPVVMKPTATLACPIVSALDRWIAESVQPSATRWLGARVVEIKQISAYSCRGMNGNPNSHISEHAFGNALDIAAFTLADGRRVTVKDGWKGMPEEQAFLREIQSAACDQFNTVLAPGSNVYHYDHIHVDLMRRNSGRVICQPAALSAEQIASRATPRGGYSRNEPDYTSSVHKGPMPKGSMRWVRGPLSKEDRDSIEDESKVR